MPDSVRIKDFRATLLDALRIAARRQSSNRVINLTQQSIAYRKRAATLAEAAEAEYDEVKMLVCVHQALYWLKLADNEELLSENELEIIRST